MFNILIVLNLGIVFACLNCLFLSTSIRSVIWLIVVLVLLGLSWLFLGLSGLSMLWIMVYAGAIAILFIFVVIMVGEVGYVEDGRKNKFINLFIVLVVFFIFLVSRNSSFLEDLLVLSDYDFIFNMKLLGFLLFTEYIIHVILIGIFLLVAALGSVFLVRCQN